MFGSLMIDLEGHTLTPIEKDLLQHQHVGGVLLFTRNYRSKSQLKDLIIEIRESAKKPLIVATDHEGGRIWRFEEGFTHTPAAEQFGLLYEHDSAVAKQHAKNAGITIAHELLNCGVDLTLAPVLDLNSINTVVIGDRAFHSNPNIVAELGEAFILGLASVGMGAVGKHFPGHGGCNIDTHAAIAYDERPYEEILKADLVPFQKLVPFLKGIMPAHVIYPDVDDVSAGFSKIWLQEILRQELNFTGAIISDCVSMKGAEFQGDFLARIQSALYAGCDMVILSQQKREFLLAILEDLNWQYTKKQLERLEKLAGDFNNPTLRQPLPDLADIWSVNS